MKKLHTLALFLMLTFAGSVHADTASNWWTANCTEGRPGRTSPVISADVYVGTGSAENLAQIGQPFSVMVRGVLKKEAALSASDSNVEFGNKTCISNNQPYPNCGQGQYEFKQEVTIKGDPRDVVIKSTDGGVLFPGETGPSTPVCIKVPVYRTTQSYEYSIELDKTQFTSDEAFKVTVNGISWLKAKEIGSKIQFVRSNAPASSCEYAPNVGALGIVCTNDGILTCSLLPDTSKPQYLCAATGFDRTQPSRFPNRDADVTYTVSLKDTKNLFETFTFVGGSKTIKLLKYGGTSTTTNYGNCPSGQGINPQSPQSGCTRCENIPNNYRSAITSCSSVALDTFTWRGTAVTSLFGYENAPSCGANVVEGASCVGQESGCINRTAMRVYGCMNNTGSGSSYNGKVIDSVTGNPIQGVRVSGFHPTASWLGVDCNSKFTTTNSSGEYRFDSSNSYCLGFFGAWVNFKKEGYADARTSVGTEFNKKIPDTRMTTGGASSVFPLVVENPDQTMNGNTVTFVIRNAVPGKVEACAQVINHPNLPNSNTSESTPCSSWISATDWAPGNAEWKFDASQNTLTGTFRADAKDGNGSPIWNIPGLVIRSSFRNEGTTNVVTATMRVAGNPAGKSLESGSTENQLDDSSDKSGDDIVSGILQGFVNDPAGMTLWLINRWYQGAVDRGVFVVDLIARGFGNIVDLAVDAWSSLFGRDNSSNEPDNDGRYRFPGDGTNDDGGNGSVDDNRIPNGDGGVGDDGGNQNGDGTSGGSDGSDGDNNGYVDVGDTGNDSAGGYNEALDDAASRQTGAGNSIEGDPGVDAFGGSGGGSVDSGSGGGYSDNDAGPGSGPGNLGEEWDGGGGSGDSSLWDDFLYSVLGE